MSSLWKKWYKVDELKVEIADLKKRVKQAEMDSMNLSNIKEELEAKLELPVRQAYESMKNREFLSLPENQK